MSDILEKLAKIKLDRQIKRNHEAIIQIKVKTEVRDKLLEELEKEGLNYKDLFMAAIETYLESKQR